MQRSTILAAGALVLATATLVRGDFTLTGTQHLDVTTDHTNGVLFDSSTADVLSGGYMCWAYVHDQARLAVRRPSGDAIGTVQVYNAGRIAISSSRVLRLYAYNMSSVDMSGGSVCWPRLYGSSTLTMSGGSVTGYLYAYDTSSVDVSGGSISDRLSAYGTSSVDIRGGTLANLNACDSASMAMSGGNVSLLYGRQSSSLDISGGSVSHLTTYSTRIVDISGGSVSYLHAYGASSIALHGYDFQAAGGLTLHGNEVLGTGVLTGKWFDGTPWVIEIPTHDASATILAIPEPGVLSLLALGGLALISKRRKGPPGGIR